MKGVLKDIFQPVLYNVTGISKGSLVSNWTQLLPQKLIVTPDAYIDEMDATTGWSPSAGSIALNTTEKWSGSGSVKFTTPSTGTNAHIIKTINWDISSDDGNSVRVMVYPHGSVTGINGFSILMMDASFNYIIGYYYYSTPGVTLVADQWNLLGNVSLSDEGSAPNKSSIVHLMLRVWKEEGTAVNCSFDLVRYGSRIKNAVLLMFDDIYVEAYSTAYPLIKSKQMVATMYVPSSFINNGTAMTSSQIQALYSAGWDIANHGVTHTNFTTLTQAQIETELNTCKGILDGLGLTRASSHVAYPFGVSDADTLAAMSSFGAKTGRVITGILAPSNLYDVNWPYAIESIAIDNTNSFNDIKTIIDTAIIRGTVPVLLLHRITPTGVEANAWSEANFILLLNYIETLGIQTLTIDEYYRLYSGPITVHHK